MATALSSLLQGPDLTQASTGSALAREPISRRFLLLWRVVFGSHRGIPPSELVISLVCEGSPEAPHPAGHFLQPGERAEPRSSPGMACRPPGLANWGGARGRTAVGLTAAQAAAALHSPGGPQVTLSQI